MTAMSLRMPSHEHVVPPSHRNRAIESLRIVGVLLLIVYHVALIAPWQSRTVISLALQRIGASAWIGTDLLLAIGGFLCFESLSRTEAYLPWLARRAFRIVPVYWAWLAIYLHLVPSLLGRFGFRPEFAATYDMFALARSHESIMWTLTTNLLFANGTPIGASLEPLLTIAIGVQLGLLTSVVHRLSRGKALPWFLLVLLGFGVGLRIAWAGGIHTYPWRIYSFPFTRCDAFAWGALSAWALRNPTWTTRVRRSAPSILKLTTGLFIITYAVTSGLRVNSPFTQIISYPVVGLMAAALVLTAALRAPTAQDATRRPFIEYFGRFGVVTYGVYLVKLPLLYVTRGALSSFGITPAPFVLLVVGTTFVGLAGALWYLLFERPLLQLVPLRQSLNTHDVSQERSEV